MGHICHKLLALFVLPFLFSDILNDDDPTGRFIHGQLRTRNTQSNDPILHCDVSGHVVCLKHQCQRNTVIFTVTVQEPLHGLGYFANAQKSVRRRVSRDQPAVGTVGQNADLKLPEDRLGRILLLLEIGDDILDPSFRFIRKVFRFIPRIDDAPDQTDEHAKTQNNNNDPNIVQQLLKKTCSPRRGCKDSPKCHLDRHPSLMSGSCRNSTPHHASSKCSGNYSGPAPISRECAVP